MRKVKVAIIGGGSSGLFLANLLNNSNCDVCLLEKNNKLGKKILASGNGKCNFTNVGDLDGKYNNLLANKIIDKYDVNKTLKAFGEKGLIYKKDEQDRCYPVSECAASVLDCLKKNLGNIKILLDSEVTKIYKKENKCFVDYNDKVDCYDYIVCCSGSKASNLGSERAYDYLKGLNLKIKEIKPSLVPLKVKENVRSLKGVRVKCTVSLLDENNVTIYKENGEVLFKEDGLSGIAIFNSSSFINRRDGKYKISLDLSGGMNNEQLFNYIKENINEYPYLFKGFLNDKIADYIVSRTDYNKINKEEQIGILFDKIKNLVFNVTGFYPFIDSQVCSGGVSLEEINDNLELKKYSNIYVSGELLDVDGICGGYNLQFAWSSAGVIADDIKRKTSN